MITECWTPQSNHRDTFFSIIICCLTSSGKTGTFAIQKVAICHFVQDHKHFSPDSLLASHKHIKMGVVFECDKATKL